MKKPQHSPSKEITHVGFMPERIIFQGAVLERAFVEAWMEANKESNGQFLNRILNGGRVDEFVNVGQHEARIAATVVQWLGTNVGYSFLLEVFKNSGERYRENLITSLRS